MGRRGARPIPPPRPHRGPVPTRRRAAPCVRAAHRRCRSPRGWLRRRWWPAPWRRYGLRTGCRCRRLLRARPPGDEGGHRHRRGEDVLDDRTHRGVEPAGGVELDHHQLCARAGGACQALVDVVGWRGRDGAVHRSTSAPAGARPGLRCEQGSTRPIKARMALVEVRSAEGGAGIQSLRRSLRADGPRLFNRSVEAIPEFSSTPTFLTARKWRAPLPGSPSPRIPPALLCGTGRSGVKGLNGRRSGPCAGGRALVGGRAGRRPGGGELAQLAGVVRLRDALGGLFVKAFAPPWPSRACRQPRARVPCASPRRW